MDWAPKILMLTVLGPSAWGEPAAFQESADEPTNPVSLHYDDGLEIESADGNFRAHIEWRFQLRLSNTESEEHPGPGEAIGDTEEFGINRARFKMGGHAYRPWLEYYLEQDLADTRLLDLRFMIQPTDEAGVRIGQYKVLYNRERVDSSGKQQFVERSIVTKPFTVDRQQGITLMGRLFEERAADSRYALGVFTGTGRGGGGDDDGQPMFVGRWQWNFLRRDLGFSQSDIGRRPDPAATLALGAATNRSRFTRFSSDGGGQITGFEDGESGQYDTEQAMVEFAYQGRGLSLQAEQHWKDIDDRVNQTTTNLHGYYAQAGYFFSEMFTGFPEPLELGLRYASVNNEAEFSPSQEEYTAVANWFFHGHKNKLTFDLSYLANFADDGLEVDDGWRIRLQWDVSF